MENPVLLTVLFRGGLAVLLAIIGGCCVYLGYRLLFTRSSNKTKSTFEVEASGHKLSFSTGTAGTAVIFTSVIWVISAAITVPTLKLPEGATVSLGPEATNLTGVEQVATLNFEGDHVSLTAAQKKSLDAFLSQINTTPSRQSIVIEGYATVGPSSVNAAIAEQRSLAVKNYIIQKYRFNPEFISVHSYGETPPTEDANKNSVVLTATRVPEGG